MSKTIPGPAYRVLTPRLCLRCWNPEDAPRLKTAIDASREHLSPWMPWAQQEEPLQYYIGRLRRFRGQFDMNQDFIYAIFNRDESQVLGSSGLHTRGESHAREIGYWVHVDQIGKGYGTETAAGLTKVAFEIDGVDRVEIHCDPANQASAAIPQKLDYIHEATLHRRSRWDDEKMTDSMIWTLFASDYAQSPAAQIEVQAFDAAGREIPLVR